MRRKRRVRVHLIAPEGGELPSIEGLMVSRHTNEYVIGIPSLLMAVGANPAELEARELRIPRERVAFYEVLT